MHAQSALAYPSCSYTSRHNQQMRVQKKINKFGNHITDYNLLVTHKPSYLWPRQDNQRHKSISNCICELYDTCNSNTSSKVVSCKPYRRSNQALKITCRVENSPNTVNDDWEDLETYNNKGTRKQLYKKLASILGPWKEGLGIIHGLRVGGFNSKFVSKTLQYYLLACTHGDEVRKYTHI